MEARRLCRTHPAPLAQAVWPERKALLWACMVRIISHRTFSFIEITVKSVPP